MLSGPCYARSKSAERVADAGSSLEVAAQVPASGRACEDALQVGALRKADRMIGGVSRPLDLPEWPARSSRRTVKAGIEVGGGYARRAGGKDQLSARPQDPQCEAGQALVCAERSLHVGLPTGE